MPQCYPKVLLFQDQLNQTMIYYARILPFYLALQQSKTMENSQEYLKTELEALNFLHHQEE